MNFLPNIRRMLAIYKSARGQFIISQILVLIAAIFSLLIPTQVGRLVNQGVLAGDRDVIIDASLNMLLFAVLAGAFTVGNLVYAAAFAEGTANYVRARAYRKAQTFSFGNLDKFPTGELMIRLTSDVYQIKLAVNMAVRFLLSAPFQIIVAIILVAINSPNLLWILFVMVIAVAIVLVLIVFRMQPLYKARQQKLDTVNNVLQEDLAGMRVVKAFERQVYENQRYDAMNRTYRDAAVAPMHVQAFLSQ